MELQNWLFTALWVLQAHFAASYLVPLDEESQREFGGLLRWVWPWSGGDSGLLGQVTVASGFPLSGFFLAAIAAVLFIMAALAVVGFWVPFGWWRVLAGGGAVLSLVLMAGFFGATKVLPLALDLVVLWAAITDWLPPTG
jgi:small-conductance mechanosensitive channel